MFEDKLVNLTFAFPDDRSAPPIFFTSKLTATLAPALSSFFGASLLSVMFDSSTTPTNELVA